MLEIFIGDKAVSTPGAMCVMPRIGERLNVDVRDKWRLVVYARNGPVRVSFADGIDDASMGHDQRWVPRGATFSADVQWPFYRISCHRRKWSRKWRPFAPAVLASRSRYA